MYKLFLKILAKANSVDPDQAPLGAVTVIWVCTICIKYAILSGTVVYKILGHLPFTSEEPQRCTSDECTMSYPQRIFMVVSTHQKCLGGAFQMSTHAQHMFSWENIQS